MHTTVSRARSFVERLGSAMTVTLADVAMLWRTQKEPDRYGHLRVRLGGSQAFFVRGEWPIWTPPARRICGVSPSTAVYLWPAPPPGHTSHAAPGHEPDHPLTAPAVSPPMRKRCPRK
jgi:hypothetical protein